MTLVTLSVMLPRSRYISLIGCGSKDADKNVEEDVVEVAVGLQHRSLRCRRTF